MTVTLNPGTEVDPVRRNTSAEDLLEIERHIQRNIEFYSTQPDAVLNRRIADLRRQWSMERILQADAASVGFLSAFLAIVGHRRWGLITCAAFGLFLYHTQRGFELPIPILRKMGVRTRGEIDRELYALKAVRGDFKSLPELGQPQTIAPDEVLEAVNA